MQRERQRLLAAVLGIVGLVAATVACGGSAGQAVGDNGVEITPISLIPTATPAGGSLTPAATTPSGDAESPLATSPSGGAEPPVATLPPSAAPTLSGFIWPIAGACLPSSDQLMPNAARVYRNGIHEGVDFYGADNCTAIELATPVLAAKDGVVVRADLDYHDLTQAELDAYTANPNTEEALDHFRGRQVWVLHETTSQGQVITRYAHLSGIADGVTVGQTVTAGQPIAYVGESGTPESLSNPGNEMHLHFELRIGASFLGRGLSAEEVRALYQALFTP